MLTSLQNDSMIEIKAYKMQMLTSMQNDNATNAFISMNRNARTNDESTNIMAVAYHSR